MDLGKNREEEAKGTGSGEGKEALGEQRQGGDEEYVSGGSDGDDEDDDAKRASVAKAKPKKAAAGAVGGAGSIGDDEDEPMVGSSSGAAAAAASSGGSKKPVAARAKAASAAAAPQKDSKPKKKDAQKRVSKQKGSKKPKDMPRRPMSAYNCFFRQKRSEILEEARASNAASGETIGFESMAKRIAKLWKEITPEELEPYQKRAQEDMERYRREMDEYQLKVARRYRLEREKAAADSSRSEDAMPPAVASLSSIPGLSFAASSPFAMATAGSHQGMQQQAPAPGHPQAVDPLVAAFLSGQLELHHQQQQQEQQQQQLDSIGTIQLLQQLLSSGNQQQQQQRQQLQQQQQSDQANILQALQQLLPSSSHQSFGLHQQQQLQQHQSQLFFPQQSSQDFSSSQQHQQLTSAQISALLGGGGGGGSQQHQSAPFEQPDPFAAFLRQHQLQQQAPTFQHQAASAPSADHLSALQQLLLLQQRGDGVGTTEAGGREAGNPSAQHPPGRPPDRGDRGHQGGEGKADPEKKDAAS